MKSTRVAEPDSVDIPDRRQRSRRARGRRASDLDGAYNDGTSPSPLRLSNGAGLYGGIVWIVITSAIGSFVVLKSAWGFLSTLWTH